MFFKRLRETLYDESIDIRKRTFVMNVMNVIMMLLITTFEIIFMKEMWMESISTLLAAGVMLAVSIYFMKRDKADVAAIIVCFIMGFIYFPITFLNGGGIRGVGPMWFIFNMFLINTLLRGKPRVAFLVTETLICIVCYIIIFLHPELIPSYESWVSYLYSFTTLILVSVAITVMLYYENRLYVTANERSKKQNEEIEALYASQNRFFSSMSHEIRTPINTIIGLNEMILREDISDEIAEDAVNIRSASKMLLNTINDILDMSKFQAGDMGLLIDKYSIGETLSDLVGMLWIKAKEKNLDFKINVAPDIPTELRGDEVRIKQILMNILNNAIKYTKEGYVSLSVECERQEDGNCNMIFSVEDTGMGIKKEDIPYLFSAFRRVNEDDTKHIEGTGLGLSIVKQFLDLMGGKVTVNSVYTKGTTFIIEIPQKIASERELGEYDYESRHKLKKRTAYKKRFEAPDAKLLVVDDNEANLMVVTKLLRETKIQIDTVKSGREALEKTLDTGYNLIFMDHLMPEMNGVECFQNIRNQQGGKNRDTNIVVLTANAGEENRALYADVGFNGYLVKPVTGELLENEVYSFLPKELVKMADEGGEIIEDNVSWAKATVAKKKIAITTESVADIPEAIRKKYNIEVVAHKVQTSEGTIFKEGVEIDTSGVLSYMEDKNHVMIPLPPTVEEHEAFFAEQLTKANNIIHFTNSSKVQSSSYQNAASAGNSFDNVTVVDSGHVSSGEGLMVIAACRMAEAGMPVEEIVQKLTLGQGKFRTSFIVDNLEFLARSKQISERRSEIFNIFMLKPVLVLKDGVMGSNKIMMGSREKVWKKYIDGVLSDRNMDKRVLFVTYVGLDKKELEFIRKCIDKKQEFDAIFFVEASPAIACSCGKGTFGLFLMDK
ncbi:MAG: DegV family EDD domain-containing protein [Eubacterium sp.]|nr:DegV family EDD domain-containing protein [Eubacterium sp.]